MKKALTRALALSAGLAFVSGAAAQNWVEVPDAGELAPQVTVGVGPLLTITGATNDPNDTGVDMFCIRVVDWSLFSASLVGTTTFDTQLFLFDSAGFGIAFNDDVGGGPLQSELPAGSALYAGRTNGELVNIAVSGYNRDPSSAGGLIFPNTFTGVFGPTGAGGGSPLSSWSGTPATGAYVLNLRGVEYCEVPAPGSLAVLTLGGLVAIRRRR